MTSLRFSEAMEAIGTDAAPDVLRSWLKRGQAQLAGGFGGSWANFTLTDIANLALMRVLATDFNIPVAEAFQIAKAVIAKHRQPRFKAEGEALWRGWEHHYLVLRRTKGRQGWSIKRGRLAAIGKFIVVDVGRIIRPAIERARRS